MIQGELGSARDREDGAVHAALAGLHHQRRFQRRLCGGPGRLRAAGPHPGSRRLKLLGRASAARQQHPAGMNPGHNLLHVTSVSTQMSGRLADTRSVSSPRQCSGRQLQLGCHEGKHFVEAQMLCWPGCSRRHLACNKLIRGWHSQLMRVESPDTWRGVCCAGKGRATGVKPGTVLAVVQGARGERSG